MTMPKWCTAFEYMCKASQIKRSVPKMNALCRRRPHYSGNLCAVSTNERAMPFCRNRLQYLLNTCWLSIFGRKKVYMFRRALTRETRWRPYYAATSLISKVIRKKTFLSKTVILMFFLPLVPKYLTLHQIRPQGSKKKIKKLSNDFFRDLLPRVVSEIPAYFRKKYGISL